MAERPITFLSVLVEAILANEKTQTRRLRGLEIINENPNDWRVDGYDEKHGFCFEQISKSDRTTGSGLAIKCPYGKPGDSLWVREPYTPTTKRVYEDGEYSERYGIEFCGTFYETPDLSAWLATERKRRVKTPWIHREQNALFMPRWASRISREIISVRPERLRSISRSDAAAEGICYLAKIDWKERFDDIFIIQHHHWPEDNFIRLFESLNAKKMPYRGWNPWVWVIEWSNEKKSGLAIPTPSTEVHPFKREIELPDYIGGLGIV